MNDHHANDKVPRAREAFRLANDMHADLVVATNLYAKFRVLDEEILRVGVARLCLFSIALTLVKWIDFYNQFNRTIPASERSAAKELKKEVESRNVRPFRDMVAAHFKDKGGRIPGSTEVEEAVRRMTGPDILAFLSWINDLEGIRSETVVLRIERIRDRIREENELGDQDLYS